MPRQTAALFPAETVGGCEIKNVESTVDVPHSFPEVKDTVCVPKEENETLPGEAEVELAGVPPLKFH